MPRGGARIGAGRKPKPQSENVIEGTFDGGQGSFTEPVPVSLIPPEDLPLGGREFWHQWASLAIEAGTLTPRTVPGFRWLCETYAEMRANEQTIERDGRTYIKCTVDGSGQEHQELKAHPLTTTLNRLRKDVDSGMARFCLTAFGKPVPRTVKSKADQQKANLRTKFFGGVRG